MTPWQSLWTPTKKRFFAELSSLNFSLQGVVKKHECGRSNVEELLLIVMKLNYEPGKLTNLVQFGSNSFLRVFQRY